MSTCPSRSTGAYAMHGAASGKYTLELYDRSSAPLELNTWMLRAEVLEILLYGCATWSSRTCHNDTLRRDKHRFLTCYIFSFFSSFSFISLIADGPHHYHPACGHKGSSHLSLVHALQFFYRDASSALLQLVNQWLNFTYSRSHAFRYERNNTNPT